LRAEEGRGHDQLFPFTEIMQDASGLSVRIISLKKLIEIKSESGRPKDEFMIPMLLKLDQQR